MFLTNIENIDTKMYLHGFKERKFSIQEQYSCVFLSVQINNCILFFDFHIFIYLVFFPFKS